jgi:hypothetical protein
MGTWIRAALCVVASGLVLALGWTVWPTPYRYDHMSETVVRMNRLTGRAQALGSHGWYDLAPPANANLKPTTYESTYDIENIASQDLKRIAIGNLTFDQARDTGGKVIDFGGSKLVDLSVEVFNGTRYTLMEIDLELDERNKREKPILIKLNGPIKCG